MPTEGVDLTPASLQARHIESEESEQDEEASDSSAELEADTDAGGDSKLALEPPNTTPAVESNSVV